MGNVQKYMLDCGKLLDKNNPEFEFYTTYDKQYGYLDLMQSIETNLDKIIEFAKIYVEKTINRYVVISKAKKTIICDNFEIDDCDFDVESVVYSIMTDSNGNIKENFIKGENAKHDNVY